LSHVAVKATAATAPEAAEATTAAPRIAERPTDAYEATREAACLIGLKMKNPAAPAVKREAEEDWGR